MVKIGITGGIGSGKSIVSTLFQLHVIPVYNADEQTKALNNTSPIIKEQLIKHFGEDLYLNDELDKKKFANIIFNDPEKLKIALFTDAYDPVISGVVVSVDNLRYGLEAIGHDVYIITTKSNKAKIKDDPKIIRVPGIGLVKKSLSGFRYVPFVGRYASKIRKMNFDIIHVHTELTMGKLAVLTKKWTGAPLIYTSHTIYDDAGGYVNKRFETILYPILGKIIHNIIGKFSKTADEIVVPTIKGQEY